MIDLNFTSTHALNFAETNSTDIIAQNATEIANASITPSQTPSNSTAQNSTNTNNDEHTMSELRLSILVYLLVFFMLLGCMQPSTPHTAHRQYIGEDEDSEERQRQRAMRRRRRQRRREEKKKNKMDPDERKKITDASLITATISSCDEESGAVLVLSSGTSPSQTDEEEGQQPNNDEKRQEHTELDNYDDEANSCMICLEPYAVGDKVSYSKHNALQCRHVFHKECITDWLMRQDDCPCCRTPYIVQTDDDNHSTSQQSQSEQTNNGQNVHNLDIEAGKSLSRDEDDTNGVLYIVDGIISNKMYTLFSIKDDDADEEQQIGTNTLDTNQIVEDARTIRSAERSSIIRRSLFSHSQQHLAAYTSVSINEEDGGGAFENNSERNNSMKHATDGDGHDDNEAIVFESDNFDEIADSSVMEDVELGESRDDQ